MKSFFRMSTFLHWATCVAAFWVTTIMYPFSVYYHEDRVPFLGIKEIAILAGITFLLGTVMFLLLQLVGWIGGYIGFKCNLIIYFLYHFILCGGYAVGVDYLFEFIHFSPYWIYLLIGFFPAALCSVIHSYHVSHHRNDPIK